MSNVTPASHAALQSLGAPGGAAPSLISQLAASTSSAAAIEASIGATLGNGLNGDNLDSATLLKLQAETAELSLQSAITSGLLQVFKGDLQGIAQKITG